MPNGDVDTSIGEPWTNFGFYYNPKLG